MKNEETSIKIITIPEADSYFNFAIDCRRDVSFINKAVKAGSLNWGNVFGIKVIILDSLAYSFKEKCKSIDAFKREKKGIKKATY